MTYLKRIFCTIVVLLGSYLVYLYTHREFNPDAFAHAIVQHERFPLSPASLSPNELKAILSQKFSYLGFGKQMTVYESEDHNYVIKFFNPRPPLRKTRFQSLRKIKYFCSLKWFSEAYFKKKTRLHKLFQRHALAFNELRDETALVYLHLNASTAPDVELHIVDKSGTLYILDPQSVPFVLQKKAILASDFLHSLSDPQHAYTALHTLFASRARKHFTDRIQTLHNNYGFINGQAVQLDFGRIKKDEALDEDKELTRIFHSLQKSWPIFREQVEDNP